MGHYLIPLIADAGPNDGTPTPSGSHYLNVDEDPHDGDTTRLRVTEGGKEAFACDWSVIPANEPILSVTVRWSAKPLTAESDNQARAGLRIAGVEFYGPTRLMEFGQGYFTFDEIFATDPATGLAWTRARLIAAVEEMFHQVGASPIVPGEPRLTQCVPIVDTGPPVDIPPERPGATAESESPAGSATGQSPSGSAVSTSPAGGAASLSASSSGSTQAPSGTAAATTPAARASTSAPAAVATMRDGSLVSFQSLSPSAALQSLSPGAAPAALPPAGEAS